jgi:hypothetical protein
MPPLATWGRLGDPSVSTWQLDAGVALLAHTLDELNPPTGKLKDCAESGCAAKKHPIKKATTPQPKDLLLRVMIFLH